MPRKSTGEYPENWDEIATAFKNEAGWKCIRCGHPHDPKSGYCLTVHHADLDPSNCRWWNCWVLDQRCHLRIQANVNLNVRYFLEHADWAKPYMAGFYAWKYQKRDITRETVMAELEELLNLERMI